MVLHTKNEKPSTKKEQGGVGGSVVDIDGLKKKKSGSIPQIKSIYKGKSILKKKKRVG